MQISVIISTYNNPAWLEKVLWGYEHQTHQDFNIVIADDGSDPPTKELIERFQRNSSLKISHAWHPDDGFQKSKILNLATTMATGEYLIFTDGDCIPRQDFVATHHRHADKEHFLSGGYCKLPMPLSQGITQADISSGQAFDTHWLSQNGLKSFSSKLKLGLPSPWNTLADRVTPTKPTWNGCNASTFKEHIIAVNGHNEEMQYGGQDREMGERLLNLGLKPVQLRHRAVLIHLDHKRGYRTDESIQKNLRIRQETKESGSTWTPNGIVKKDAR